MTSNAVVPLLPGARRRSLALALLVLPALAPAAADDLADRVLGQRHLTTAAANFVDGRGFGSVASIAVDRSAAPARVWIADAANNRVLGWRDAEAFRRGRRADLALGQPDLFAVDVSACAPAPPSADRFCRPVSVAVDGAHRVWVADWDNRRVLGFDDPFATDGVADVVIGVPDLTTRGPVDVELGPIAADRAGNLWVARFFGVVGYDRPFETDTVADRLVETSGWVQGLAVDATGNLYAGVLQIDFGGTDLRDAVEVFRDPLATDLERDAILGLDEHLERLTAVAVDDAGRVYVTSNGRIHVYESPLAGGGRFLGRLAAEGGPTALAFDERGELLVGDLWHTAVLVHEHPAIDRGADRIVGQPGFASRMPNRLDLRGMATPRAVALDESVSPPRLFVLDSGNSRVLGWRDATGFASGAPADLVIGQPSATESGCNNPAAGGVSARSLCISGLDDFPSTQHSSAGGGLAVDRHGDLWVADTENHRVLRFERPFETDAVADRVLGQRSFATRDCNRGGIGAASLCYPGALTFDAKGDLWVADLANHRVLLFRRPARDTVADRVLGQRNFRSGGCNARGLGPRSFCLSVFEHSSGFGDFFVGASGLAVDREGRLWVADWANDRVLGFDAAGTSDAVADRVLGQPGFATEGCGVSASRLCQPAGLALGPAGELWVADHGNDRVLRFAAPRSGAAADRVLGQPDLTTTSGGSGFRAVGPETLWLPSDVEVAPTGEVFVADTFDHRVLLYEAE